MNKVMHKHGFTHSTHKDLFLYPSIEKLNEQRLLVNRTDYDFIVQHGGEVPALDPGNLESLQATYLKQMRKICLNFTFPNVCKYTALSYFKHFLLRGSFVQHNLRHIAAGCIYLATKVEECTINLNPLVSEAQRHLHPKERKILAEHIINAESEVLTALSFSLKVWQPLRPLDCFLLDLGIICRQKKVPLGDDVKQLMKKKGTSVILKAVESDAPLMYPPSQIGLAAVERAAKQEKIQILLNETQKKIFNNYAMIRFGKSPEYSKLRQSLLHIDTLVCRCVKSPAHDKERVRQALTNLALYNKAYQEVNKRVGRGRDSSESVSAEPATKRLKLK